jgi:hypothetical protein
MTTIKDKIFLSAQAEMARILDILGQRDDGQSLSVRCGRLVNSYAINLFAISSLFALDLSTAFLSGTIVGGVLLIGSVILLKNLHDEEGGSFYKVAVKVEEIWSSYISNCMVVMIPYAFVSMEALKWVGRLIVAVIVVKVVAGFVMPRRDGVASHT